MKGGLAASIIAAEAFMEVYPDFPGAIEISGHGRRGIRRLRRRRLPGAARATSRSPRVDHVIIPEPLNKDRICLGHRGVWWAEIETKGEIAHGSMPFLGDCAVRHMGAVLAGLRGRAVPGARPQADAHAGRAGRRAALDHEHQLDPWRPDRGFPARPALAQRAGFLPAHDRPALPARRRHRRGEGRGDGDPRPAEARAPEIRLRDPRRHGGAAADDRARRAGGRSRRRTASARCSAGSRTT